MITYGPINFEDPAEVYEAAKIHESAPLNWDPGYKVREPRIQNWCKFLNKAATDSSIFVISAKDPAGGIVGLHWLQLTEKYGEKCAHIQTLWVSEKHRKSGIGRELKKRGEEWAKARGAKFAVTEVFYANKKMIDYNLKLGFSARQVEMIKDL
jgi:GNAT superfamily N-acetyltransferase